MSVLPPLPVDEALAALRAALTSRRVAVLEAPPGAGKTTRVPLALLDAPWLAGQKLIMLEPRRLAARGAAHYMARLLGERVGERVGFRVRGETRVGPRTRIEVVTEGVLARLLSEDASLEGTGLVLFDEFHERSLHADLGLALTLQTQQLLRPDLRILVMSATLDGDAVAALLANDEGDAPVVRSTGRQFPVHTEYRPRRPEDRLEAHVARVIRESLQHDAGDMLVFLPGAAEQRRVAERLHGSDAMHAARATVHLLHGSMPLAEQDAAIAPAPEGMRKIVLATSIAETSLTIEGVRLVIDAGLSRLPRYSARAGLTRLETVRVSRASADQRRGRAGRVAPGRCYRLWDQHEDAMLSPRTRPEILEADLASLALELADAGISDPAALRWLDAPPSGAFQQARELLQQLGALDASPTDTGRITPHGRQMVALPLHPRLAHLLIAASALGCTRDGAAMAALIEERDFLRGEQGPPVADLRLRLELLHGASSHSMAATLAGAQLDRDALRRAQKTADDLVRRATGDVRDARTASTASNVANARNSNNTHDRRQATDAIDAGRLVALAYPERVAQRRSGSEPRYLLRNGTGASLARHDAMADAPFLAIAELDGTPPEYRIARAAPLTRADVLALFAGQIVRETTVEWHDDAHAVRARRRATLGALVLEEGNVASPDAGQVLDALLGAIERAGVGALPWSAAAARLRARLAFLHVNAHAHVRLRANREESTRAEWPSVSDDVLTTAVRIWLAPHLDGVRSWEALARVDLESALLGRLTWEQRAELDRLAPTHLEVPSGSRIAIDYSDPAAPVLAVKLQEVFGWSSTPLLLDGRVPVTLHLLSPAQRPVQVTRDLAGFWRTSYFDVRKELRGRYPRHPWPEDPLTATATRRAKPRGT